MSEIKLSLSIELQGSTMLSKEECLKTTQKEVNKNIENLTQSCVRFFFCIKDTEKRQTGNFVKQIIKDLLKI